MKTTDKIRTWLIQLPALLILCALGLYAHAGSYSFTHYQVENGLSNNAVLCSIQDKHGFMWFGTKDGLNRFDGYTFKVFRNNLANTASIGNNIVYCLCLDHSGNLWVGTDRGIYRYDEISESFTFLKEGSENEIRDIKEDNKGNLWFIAGNELRRYNLKSRKIDRFDCCDLTATSITFADGSLWVATASKFIEKYDPHTNTFIAFDVFKHSPRATSYWVQKLYYAGDHRLLIGTANQGFKLFNTQSNDYKDVLTRNADNTDLFVRDFIAETSDKTWIATESGIYVYSLSTGKTTLLHKQYNDPYALSDNAVYTFCKDKEGGIWTGTYFGGLNYFDRQYTFFEKYFPKVGENSLSGNAVREICPDQSGDLWIGTEDAGLNKFNPKTGAFVNYRPLGKPWEISTSNIHGLVTYKNFLLIGTFEHGLDIMNIQTGKVIQHYAFYNDTTLKSNFFYTLYKTSNNNIIAGTSRGLYYFSLSGKHFIHIRQVPTDIFYTAVFEDTDGTIWAGTYRNGLYYFNPKTTARGSFAYNPKESNSISNNKINRIFKDSNGNLWIATENGLCRFNKTTRTFQRFGVKDGFPSSVIYAMLEDSRKNLWITTSKGLVCLNLKTLGVTVYTKANGLLSDQFNYNSCYKDNQGNIYLGCVKGIIKFNPDGFQTNNYQPPVYFTGFQVNNRDVGINDKSSPLKKSISFTQTIELRYNQSSFSIDFAALSYTSPQTTSYAYQMTGLDKDWVYLHSNRKVYFTRLQPGTYSFKVKASVNNSVWSNYPCKLLIIINPPFWESTYAYVTYCVLLILIIYLIVLNYHRATERKNRHKIELLENEKQREIYHAKIAFFTHVAHEIRTPLTLIAGPMEKVMNKAEQVPDIKKNLSIMERNTQRLLSLTNQLLDFSKTESNGFSLAFVKTDIVALIRDCMIRFKDVARLRNIQLKFESAERQFFAYVDAEALNKILSNLLDNAVKYGSSKVVVQLVVGGEENAFTIFTRSDGNLIPHDMKDKIFESFFRLNDAKKQPGTGIGLSLCSYLAELHKGSLSLQPSAEGMNVFALTLPIHQAVEFNL